MTIYLFHEKKNDAFVSLIKVYLVYQDNHVQHVFLVKKVIEVSQVHPVCQGKKENQ